MPIPERLQIPPVPPEQIEAMSPLCDAIEDAYSAEDAVELLAEWNNRASRIFEWHEFRSYWKAIDKEDFIREALQPAPQYVADVTWPELLAVAESVRSAELPDEAAQSYYLHWLEANLPGANVSDLIYWPNVWFGDDSLFLDRFHQFKPEAELTAAQVLRYALLRSGRELPDVPEVELPFPLPEE